jgi:hypothetical protein
MPEGEAGYGFAFSSSVCGAWSDPRTSTVPSAIPAQRVHLEKGADVPVTLGIERQVVRRHLDRHIVLVGADEGHFLAGGHVQEMHAGAGFTRHPGQATGGDHRRLDIAPLRVARGITLAAKMLAGVQSRLVLGMHRDAAADPREYGTEAVIVGDEQVAGR